MTNLISKGDEEFLVTVRNSQGMLYLIEHVKSVTYDTCFVTVRIEISDGRSPLLPEGVGARYLERTFYLPAEISVRPTPKTAS